MQPGNYIKKIIEEERHLKCLSFICNHNKKRAVNTTLNIKILFSSVFVRFLLIESGRGRRT